ncbi:MULTISPECIES: CatB-related O-acetyltransferase [Microbacterium]|uniref:CatB-related O-acetyltransferase n=1 Tax=Microbacterium TaxID=33882 RepID=UPI00217D8F53|nr:MULTISPECIES: CatB-related O-acetyltransferase [Microbacterium]UWF77017.1 CatB-related O-acetyltransferase [Microbacterium neungamense]WCM55177.1 CatB-related O-acetyltransferase [Microbacterium sp. EF45047]
MTLDDSRLALHARVAHHASLRSCSVGTFTSIGRFSKIAFADLGSFGSVSWDVTIGAISHPMTHLTTHAFPYVPELGISRDPRSQQVDRVAIGHDVWIGTQAIVMPGVSIGNGAVIDTVIVCPDVEPYSVVAGAPARKLRMRFSDDVIADLEELRWWELPVETLRSNIDVFRTDDIRSAIERLRAVAHYPVQ